MNVVVALRACSTWRFDVNSNFSFAKGASVNDCAFNAKKEVDRVVEKLRNFQDVQNPVVEAISEDAQLASMAN